MPFCVLMREKGDRDLDGKGGGEDLGEVAEEKIVIRIYCVEEENLFSIKNYFKIRNFS